MFFPPPALTHLPHFTALTKPQRDIFAKVKGYILASRKGPLSKAGKLTMLNTFPASERAFVTRLAEELHLSLRFDEFDENDNNILTLTLPGVQEDDEDGGVSKNEEEKEANGTSSSDAEVVEESSGGPPDSDWEDTSGDDDDADNEESRIAVDRVLNKYDKAPAFDDEEGGGFEARHERSIREKMDEWKRGYYQVHKAEHRTELFFRADWFDVSRERWRFHMTIRRAWVIWCIDMSRGCSG